MAQNVFLDQLHERARAAGGMTLSVLAETCADAFANLGYGDDYGPTSGVTTRDYYESLTVPELREKLEKRGILVDDFQGSGKDGSIVKADLVDALLAGNVDEDGDAPV